MLPTVSQTSSRYIKKRKGEDSDDGYGLLDVGRLKPFAYRPLDHDKDSFRLLEVLSTDQSRPIECKLFHASISESKNQYTALSYTWGEAVPIDQQKIVVINGHRLHVRYNLYKFLRSHQNKSTGKYLWADAICIDQSEVKEKNHQVGLMREIYSGAAQVTVWLGLLPRAQFKWDGALVQSDPGWVQQLLTIVEQGGGVSKLGNAEAVLVGMKSLSLLPPGLGCGSCRK